MVSLADYVDRKSKLLCIIKRLPVLFKYAVIDIETTGLRFKDDEVVAFGLAYRKYLLGCVRMYANAQEFRELVRDVVMSLLSDGVRVYAWNKDFEESFLDIYGIRELQLRDFEKKDESLRLGIDVIVNGKDVPKLWKRWLEYRDAEALLKILWRAMYDAYVEAISLYRKHLHYVNYTKKVIEP